MKRVLLVSYFFAPAETVGAARPTKLYQQLPDFGWEPTVLTVRLSETGSAWPRVVRTECRRLWGSRQAQPSGESRARPNNGGAPLRWTLRQAAQRSKVWNQVYFLLRHVLPLSSVRMPDATLGWVPDARRAGQELLRRERFAAIWSTSGPPSSHLVANSLHRASGLPWVADYRDPWSRNYADRRLGFFEWAESLWERRVVAPAQVVTAVSEGFARVQGELLGRQVEVVYNGYDDDVTLPDEPGEPRFTLRYTGTLYPEMRDLRPFLAALKEARRRRPDFALRVEFIGPELRWLEALVAESELSDIVTCAASVPACEALRLQAAASALLLFGWSRASMPGWLPVKIFEYMRAGRPVLEIGDKTTESAAILAQCKAGVTVERTEEIVDLLLAWHDEFAAHGCLRSNVDAAQVARYSRRAQTRRLAEILDAL